MIHFTTPQKPLTNLNQTQTPSNHTIPIDQTQTVASHNTDTLRCHYTTLHRHHHRTTTTHSTNRAMGRHKAKAVNGFHRNRGTPLAPPFPFRVPEKCVAVSLHFCGYHRRYHHVATPPRHRSHHGVCAQPCSLKR